MVRIVNGEIVPDDSPVRQRNNQTPEARPFPNAWNNNPSFSSSNQNAQQYQFVHPDPPPQANGNNQFAWLDETRTIFGQTMKVRDLLICALISCFLFGLPTTIILGVFIFFGSTNAVNQRFQQNQGNRNPAPVQQTNSVIGSFISSFFVPPTPQQDPNDPNNANPGN